MRVVGLGTDLVMIDRVRGLRERFGSRFLKRVFHKNEIEYCLDKTDPDIHLAARFAVKEALGKAAQVGIFRFRLNEILLENNPLGRPELKILGKNKDILKKLGAKNYHVSMSHEGNYALAVVILEGE